MEFEIEIEQETDDRWIAEMTRVPGVICYGATREEAIAAAQALAIQVLTDFANR